MRDICRQLLLAALLCLGTSLAARAQEPAPARTVEQLREQIERHLAQPKFSAAVWGIKIVSLDSGRTLFEDHGDRLMSPASNTKLYTGALGLDVLGGDYRFATPVYAVGNISRSGTLRGNLVVVGQGDPTWNQRRLGTNFWTIFEPFITILTNAGVRRIHGDVIADATFFRGPSTGSSWTIDDLDEGETGLISALTLDDNLAQLRVEPGAGVGSPCRLALVQPGTGLIFSNQAVTVAPGSRPRLEVYQPPHADTIYVLGELPAGSSGQTLDVAVPQPAGWFARALKLALARHGIAVSGNALDLAPPAATTRQWNAAALKLGLVSSPPLRDVVRGFMKLSQNLEADLLLAAVGEVARDPAGPPGQTSEKAGLATLQRFLGTAGIAPGDVYFDEGSGLSRNNLTTANATVALLQFMATHPAAQDFAASLPVAGVDGTLRSRFRNTAAAGRVMAKTGTLRWAHALSGYGTTAAGERLAFSIMLNRFAALPGHSGHEEIDPLVLMLANFAGRSDQSLADTYAPWGTLLVTQFVNAPFPHPDRAAGHRYHDEFFPAAEHYSDSTVALFIPKQFRAAARVDVVVHFHGWRHTVAGTLEEYKLIEQFAGSGKNAVLLVPQGPRNAADSFGGKLEDTNGFKAFMDEAAGKLRAAGVLARTNFDIGSVILSGHSGGYHVMAAILNHGGLAGKIREVWLFDALYGNADDFVAWQKNADGRLLDLYTDHGGTKEESELIMANYQTNGVNVFAAEDTNAIPQNLETNRIVFLHSDLAHDDVLSKRGAFGEFLKTSCLQNQ
ncbi:MAG: D-alanyl-D-alanine carboxypeptidase/D-alanyl-D-alanine-endopeptidase [Verrucomicrobiota bacterium]